MALDGIILNKVYENLNSKLPIRINRISETSKTELVFNIHSEAKRTNMVISLHSVYNHLCLSDLNYTTYQDPSTFVMVLRKYILNGVIYKIEQLDYDRYLYLYIRAKDDLYDTKEYMLSIELMGKYANVILVDQETNKIIDAYRKIPPFENTKRTILQGSIFTPIEKQNKLNPFKIDSFNLDESMLNGLQGFSKILESEVRYRIDNGESFKDIMNQIKDSNKLYLSKVKDNYEYHVIPLTHLNSDVEEYDIDNGFDRLYYEMDEKERIKNVTDDIFKFVKKQIKHFTTKLEKLNSSLEDALNLEADKEYGDLLYTYSNLSVKGLKEIEVEDYNSNKVIIKLDPKLSIKDNANKYYSSYTKKRKGKDFILEQIDIANNELMYFTSLSEQLQIANYEDALEIKDELNRYGYLRKKNFKATNKKKKKNNLYQIEYKDYLITFGKNNTQNDILTFDYAKKNYLWFHAKDFHGAHLVINSNDINEETLRLCANLAAYYSQGRLSSSVPVNYLEVKDIKKIKGAKPGFVSIKNYKTIYVDPIEPKDLVIKTI